MKYEIETYKGQLIEYDDDYDKFICDISIEDKYKSSKRASLKDIRKEIDTFIKINLEFKPFKAIFLNEYGGYEFYEYLVQAIRTDGQFVISDNNTRKSYANKKRMEQCMVYDIDILTEKKHIESELDKMREECRKKIMALNKRLVKMDLSKYDKFINQSTE